MLRRIAVSNQSGCVDHFLIDPLVQARHLGSGWQNRLEFEDDHAGGRVSFSPAPALERTALPGRSLTHTAAQALAVLRIATGFVFLWAFADKMFGLGYSTPSAKAWINGGSPTKGFLSSIDAGPFQGTFHNLAGTHFANWAFML